MINARRHEQPPRTPVRRRNASSSDARPACRQTSAAPVGDDTAARDDHHVVAERADLVDHVGRKQDARARVAHAAKHVAKSMDAGNIEPVGRLVEEQVRGSVDERASERDLHALPLREASRPPIGHPFEAELRPERPARARTARRAGCPGAGRSRRCSREPSAARTAPCDRAARRAAAGARWVCCRPDRRGSQPSSARRSPQIRPRVVVLPAPFSPSSPVMAPSGAVNEMSRTACTGPKLLRRARLESWKPASSAPPASWRAIR